MTRVAKRERLSSTAMPWNPVASEPQSRMVTISARTTPASPTKAMCSRRPRGGKRSRSMRTKPVMASTAAGAMTRRLTTGRVMASVISSPGEGDGGGRLGLHLGDQRAHARLRLARERERVDADPEDEGEHGHEDRPLPDRQIGEPPVLLARHLAEDHALVHPEQVDGGEDDPARGDDREGPADLERAHEDEELAHEAVEPGQPDGGQGDDEKEHRQGGHDLPQATEVGDEPGVPPLVEHAHDQEEGPGGKAVVDHLNDAAHHALLVEGEEPEHDEAQVADAREGDELLDVRLHGGD